MNEPQSVAVSSSLLGLQGVPAVDTCDLKIM
jgi:hypothetical protein